LKKLLKGKGVKKDKPKPEEKKASATDADKKEKKVTTLGVSWLLSPPNANS
jgi:hypothetical protein